MNSILITHIIGAILLFAYGLVFYVTSDDEEELDDAITMMFLSPFLGLIVTTFLAAILFSASITYLIKLPFLLVKRKI